MRFFFPVVPIRRFRQNLRFRSSLVVVIVFFVLFSDARQLVYQKGEPISGTEMKRIVSPSTLPHAFSSLPFPASPNRRSSLQIKALIPVKCRRFEAEHAFGLTPNLTLNSFDELVARIGAISYVQMRIDDMPVSGLHVHSRCGNLFDLDHPMALHPFRYEYRAEGFFLGCHDQANEPDPIIANNHWVISIQYSRVPHSDGISIIGADVLATSIDHSEKSCQFENDEIPADTVYFNLDLKLRSRIEEKEDVRIPWSYSVRWVESVVPWRDRWNEYFRRVGYRSSRSITSSATLNHLLIIFFLLAFYALIHKRGELCQSKHNDCADEELVNAEDVPEAKRWIFVISMVFLPPKHCRWLLPILVGVGMQILFTAALVLAALGIFGMDSKAWSLWDRLWFVPGVFSILGFVAGFVSFVFDGGSDFWVLLKTATLSIFLLVWFSLVASLCSIPLEATSWLDVLFLALSCLLTVSVGGYFASLLPIPRILVTDSIPPIPRPIPELVGCCSIRSLCLSAIFGGVLPFSVIFVEMAFFFRGIWSHKAYTFGYPAFVFCVFVVTTTLLSLVFSFIRLQKQDYRWWWHAFGTSGTGLYVLIHSFFFAVPRLSQPVSFALAFVFILSVVFFAFCIALASGSIGIVSFFAFLRLLHMFRERRAAANGSSETPTAAE